MHGEYKDSAHYTATPYEQMNAGTPPAVMGAPVMASSPAACNMTLQQLEQHLAASGHGSNEQMFNCYFVPGVMPPRCVACGRMIAEHAPPPPQQQFQYRSAGSPPHQDDTANEPEMKEENDGQVLVYEAVSLRVFFIIGAVMFFVGIAVIIALFATGVLENAPQAVVGAAVPFILAIVFTSLATRVKMQFNLQSRVFSFERSKLSPICCCLGDRCEARFEDIVGVVEQMTGVTINNMPQTDVCLLVAPSNRKLAIQMVDMYGSGPIVSGWKSFVRRRLGVSIA